MTDDLHTDGAAPTDAPVTAEPPGDVIADLPPRRLGIVAAVAVAVLVADQASKWWALNQLGDAYLCPGSKVLDAINNSLR